MTAPKNFYKHCPVRGHALKTSVPSVPSRDSVKKTL